MERVRRGDGSMHPACFMCPARIYREGSDYCDPGRFDNPNRVLKVARYRPDRCPNAGRTDTEGYSPEVLLRKMLGK